MDYIMPYVPEAIKNIPTHMDFEGQKKAEKSFQIIIVLFAIVGFIWGYITQYFSQTLYILFAGVIFSSVLTLFPWSMYRKHPLAWQPAHDEDGNIINHSKSVSGGSGGNSQNKPKKKKLKD